MTSAAGRAVLQQHAAKHASNTLLETLLIVLAVMTCVLNVDWDLTSIHLVQCCDYAATCMQHQAVF